MHVLKRNSTNFDCCFWDIIFVLVLANQSENGTSFSILNEINWFKKYDFKCFVSPPERLVGTSSLFVCCITLPLNLWKKKKKRNFAVESFKEISACQRLGPFWFMFCLKLRSRPPKLRNNRTCLGTCLNWTLQVLVLIKVTHWFFWKCGIVLEKNLFT